MQHPPGLRLVPHRVRPPARRSMVLSQCFSGRDSPNRGPPSLRTEAERGTQDSLCLLGFVGLAVGARARAPSFWWTSFRAVAADGPASLNGGSCRAVTAEEPCPAPFCTQACAQRCALNLALPCLTLLQTSSTEPHNGSLGRLWAILDPTILVLLPLHRRSTTCWAHRSPLEWQWLSQHWPHNRMAQMT